MRLSLTTKITLLAAAALSAALLISSLVFLRTFKSAHLEELRTSAELRLNQTAALVSTNELPAKLAAPRDSSLMVQVLGDDQHVLAATQNVSDMQPITADLRPASFWQQPEGEITSARKSVEGAPCLLVAKIVRSEGTRRLVVVAAPIRDVDNAESSMRRQLSWFGPLLLIGTTALIWLVVRSAMRQVDSLRAEVDAISPSRLDTRVSAPAVNDELGRLSRTMNKLLERLEASQEKQNRFVSDASHELRSPLAINRTKLEVALRNPASADWPSVAKSVLDENGRMERLVRDLLYLAKSDANALTAPMTVVDLDDVLMQEIESARTFSRVPIEASGVSAARVLGNADQLRRVAANLLDNAQRHATSRVAIMLSQDQTAETPSAMLHVIDDGPGVPVAERERIRERFARLDDARTRTDGGAGLGLAIVSEIVNRHNGELFIHDAAAVTTGRPRAFRQGASFCIRFPLAP